jgi:hypothetical protein
VQDRPYMHTSTQSKKQIKHLITTQKNNRSSHSSIAITKRLDETSQTY